MHRSINKIFARYLPLTLSVILLVTVGIIYSVLRQAPKGAEAAWYSSGGTWSYRKAITIDHNKVSGVASSTLNSFPILVSVTDSDLKYTGSGGKVASSTGGDILFTANDGTTLLNYEIESYASTTGNLIAWVRIPILSAVSDTVIYEYFGNASAPAESSGNITGTWNGNYALVTHLSEASGALALDSTSNGNNSFAGNAAYAYPTKTNGFIGNGQTFTSASSTLIYWSSISAFNGATKAVLSGWLKLSSPSVHTDLTDEAPIGFSGRPTTSYFGAGSGYNSFSSISDTNWHYYTVVYDGSQSGAARVILYIDGLLKPSSAGITPAASLSATALHLGYDWVGDGQYSDQTVDELRISTGVAYSADWIATEYNNQNSPSTFYAYGSIQTQTPVTSGDGFRSRGSSSLGWYSSSWSYRKPISIDHTKVSNIATTTYSSFPILVSVTDSDLKYTGSGGKVASSTGADILFTDSDGVSLLNYEIESYASTTGALVAWVRIPLLTSTSDYTIYEYFGNASASANSSGNSQGTWDSNYLAVWHMGDNVASTAILDSTSNARNGTAQANSNSKNTTGKFGSAQTFNGSSDYIVPANYGLPTSFTIEAWGNPTGAGNLFSEQGAAAPDAGWYDSQLEIETNNIVKSCVWTGSLSCVNSTSNLAFNLWHMFATRYDSSSQKLSGIIDGLVGASAVPVSRQTPSTGNTYWTVGLNTGTNSGNTAKFSGPIDEMRVSNIARSDGWIATEYNNQNSPATFYAYGPLSANGRKDSSFSPAPAIKARGGVRFR